MGILLDELRQHLRTVVVALRGNIGASQFVGGVVDVVAPVGGDDSLERLDLLRPAVENAQ